MPRDILFDHGNARFSYRISALIVQGNRALLQCPVGTQDFAFIGGHVAFGETAKDTLVREIREELHTDAVIGELCAVGEVFIDWGKLPDGTLRHCHQIGLYFRATVDESQLPAADSFFGYDEAGDEKYSIEYIWVPLAELPRLTVYPPEVAAHLLSGSKDVLHFTYTELPDTTRWPD
ncbi:MAG: NUDIX domain-containing protein [Clostridiales bacterium]|nr:NUDIX domain-containing protein [Clostridiales bacterium]